MIEAVNAPDTHDIIRQALLSKKNVLAMSVGKLLNAQDLFALAEKNKCTILLPSGAIAGIDAIKAAGGSPKYTELKDVAHDSWTPAYNDPQGILPWMFEQHR